jgi:hypothetical protein
MKTQIKTSLWIKNHNRVHGRLLRRTLQVLARNDKNISVGNSDGLSKKTREIDFPGF